MFFRTKKRAAIIHMASATPNIFGGKYVNGGDDSSSDTSSDASSVVDDNVSDSGVTTGAGVYFSSDDTCVLSSVAAAVAIAIVVVLLVVLLYTLLKGTFMGSTTLAQRVADCGWVVYYRRGCGYCVRQDAILGGYPAVVDCSSRRARPAGAPLPCGSPAIRGYPFWYNLRTGESRTGLQGLDDLETMAVM
jgi:hypothetical protein